jgi:hypothetical protein
MKENELAKLLLLDKIHCIECKYFQDLILNQERNLFCNLHGDRNEDDTICEDFIFFLDD